MERLIGLVRRAPAKRLREPGDRARIGTRQAGDGRIDERADPLRFRGKTRERFANRAVGSPGGGGDGRGIGFAPRRPEAGDHAGDVAFGKRIEAAVGGSASGSSA